MMITLGLLFAAISFPAILSAFTHGRSVRFPMLLLIGGLALIAVGANQTPGAFQMADLPDIVARAFAQTFN
ncbi:hypothetical protein [Histidinibacterium lentulum]|uniref:hypothetical protein n=1 Tax=Histidinibacterium lentulum TaxID=2480588 RepID=UPI0011CE7988|nr:hypothetical protein [Histidinibacterium lentulum]